MNVQIGYAIGPAVLGGLTIRSWLRLVTFAGSFESAALMPRSPGKAYLPALLRIRANWSLFCFEYAMSTYDSAPAVRVTTPATPELPRAPTPVGKLTLVLLPTRCRNSLLTADR